MQIVELDLQDFIYDEQKKTSSWKWWTILRRKDTMIPSFEQEMDSSNWIQRNGLLISVTLGYVVAGFGFTMLGSLLPFLVERYSTSENDEGMLFLFFYIFGLLFGEIGVLAMVVRFRRQRAKNPTSVSLPDDNMRCYLFGLKCSAVALVLLWICTMAPISYGVFVVCAIIFGFFLSFIDVSTNAMLSHNSETSAFALNLLHFGFGVGSFSAPFVFDSVGASNTFLVFGLFACIVFLFSMGVTQYIQRTRSEAIPMHEQMEVSDDTSSHVAIDDTWTSLWHDLRDLLKRFQYWLIISAVLFYAGAELVLGGWIASMFIEMGMEEYSSTATILYWLGIMGSRVLFSAYCHVFISGTLGTLGLLRKYLGWSILMPSCLILLSPAVPVEISLIFTCLVGVSFAPILPLLISVCGTMFGSHSASTSDSNAHANANANGTLMSIIGILFFSNMGSGILPMLTGLVAQRLSIRLAMWIGVACAVMVNIIVNLLTFLYNRQETRRVAASNISA